MKARYPVQDFNQRLHSGVILWRGVPHRIQCEDDSLDILDLVDGSTVSEDVDPAHDDLDIASFELGYINTPRGAVYITRMPLRQFKQALTQASVIEYHLTAEGPVKNRGRGQWLFTESFRDRYRVSFPKFDVSKGLIKVGGNRTSIALSPDIALTKDLEKGVITVWHKLESVGTIEPDSRVVKVPSSDKAWVISMYLSELDWEVE